jgi:hypothetical protein
MMGNFRVGGWLAVTCLSAGCGGATQAAASPESPALAAPSVASAKPALEAKAPRESRAVVAKAETKADDEDKSLTREIPTTCSGSDGCVPAAAFAERVCRGRFPNLPFAMFAKSAPWQHLFVKAVTVEPVNAYGGAQGETQMNFGEEVVVLKRRGPGSAKGVQISGPTDLDVLRWDGTCATIREEMFVTYNPGQMTTPRIVWKYLEDPIRETLLKGPMVVRAQANERKHCRESSAKNPSAECDKAMLRLTEAIIVAVRLGAAPPAPTSAPAWRKAEATASR